MGKSTIIIYKWAIYTMAMLNNQRANLSVAVARNHQGLPATQLPVDLGSIATKDPKGSQRIPKFTVRTEHVTWLNIACLCFLDLFWLLTLRFFTCSFPNGLSFYEHRLNTWKNTVERMAPKAQSAGEWRMAAPFPNLGASPATNHVAQLVIAGLLDVLQAENRKSHGCYWKCCVNP